jgi:catechol 2,3-dioxygenase-like lactoylglutathione lyase family enzyme
MARPKIRHLAILTRRPAELAEFYCNVFEMEVIRSEANGTIQYLSDGYLTVAILPHRVDGQATPGLNHFGFVVDDVGEIGKRITDAGYPGPGKRPADRPFAEYRCADIDGNLFDLSEHGFERAETGSDREQRLVRS